MVLTAVQREAVAQVSEALAGLAQVAESVSGVQALVLARVVHTIGNQVSGVHATVVDSAASGQVWAEDGYVSAPRWLADTHLVPFRVAQDRVADADWLTCTPLFAAAVASGSLSSAHVTVVRRISAATPARRAAFAPVAQYWLTVAQGCDADTLARLLRAWAAAIDDDDGAGKAWSNRALRVSPVGDEWAISGRLPAVEGARLSAVLTAIMEIDRGRVEFFV